MYLTASYPQIALFSLILIDALDYLIAPLLKSYQEKLIEKGFERP